MTPTPQQFLIPDPGQLSEEAAKVRDKHFPDYILNYVRKLSRKAWNVAINNRLFFTSGFFFLSNVKTNAKKKTVPFSKEMFLFSHFSEFSLSPEIKQPFDSEKS